MVVHQVNVNGVAAFKAEYHTIIRPYRDGVETFQVSFEGVKPEARKIHVPYGAGAVQDGQNVFNLLDVIGTNAFAVAVFEKPFQSLVPKTLYHTFGIK